MKITGFTAWLVEHDPGPKFIWRDGLPGSHGDIPRGTKPHKAVVRMETDAGLYRRDRNQPRRRAWSTWSSGAITSSSARTRCHRAAVAPDLGDRPRRRDAHDASRHRRQARLGHQIQEGRHADLADAGRQRPRVPAYASTVTWDTMDEYERYIKQCMRRGLHRLQAARLGRRRSGRRALAQPAQMDRPRRRPDVRRLRRLGLRRPRCGSAACSRSAASSGTRSRCASSS